MDTLRDQRGLPWLDDLARDVSHGLRTLRRTPVFTAVALLTLALGIGANTAIFSIVNGVILRPLDYPRPEQLMYLTTEFPALGLTRNPLSVQEYLEFRQINQSFAAVGAYRTMGGAYTTGEVNLTAGGRALRVRSISVDAASAQHAWRSAGAGTHIQRGRNQSCRGPGATARNSLVRVVANGLWRTASPWTGRECRRSASRNPWDHAIRHRCHGQPHSNLVAARTPCGYSSEPRLPHPPCHWATEGRRHASGGADGIQRIPRELGRAYRLVGPCPHESSVARGRPHASDEPVQDAIVGDARRSIWIMQVAVGFFLLIACANLANLLMARAESRRREFAVRAALGASRSRLLRQTMTEGVMLCVAGGMLGLWLARVAVQALIRAYPTSVPRMSEIAIDLSVLLFALGVSMATGVLFGLAPVAQGRINDLVTAFKEGGDRGASGAGRHHIRRTLVVVEVALAVMLVIGAGLLIRTVYNLTSVDAGFDRSRLVTFSMTLAEPYDPDTRGPAYQRLLDKLRVAPGVQGAAVMSGLPPNRSPEAIPTRIENHTASDGSAVEIVDYYQFVMGDYFETMGVPIVAGRSFEPADAASPGRVVIVNETLANRIWKGRNPIGQRVRPNLSAAIGFGGNSWHTVIGVAKDVKQSGVEKHDGNRTLRIPRPACDGCADDERGAADDPAAGRLVTDARATRAGRRSRGSHRAPPGDGLGVRGIDSPAEASGAAAWCVCRAGTAAGGGRHLRCAFLHGDGASS